MSDGDDSETFIEGAIWTSNEELLYVACCQTRKNEMKSLRMIECTTKYYSTK